VAAEHQDVAVAAATGDQQVTVIGGATAAPPIASQPRAESRQTWQTVH
jgi:hypothetical protein